MTIVKSKKIAINEPLGFEKSEVLKFLFACAKHSEISKWNKWRAKYSTQELDLSKQDFSALNLSLINLQGCDLNFCIFNEAKLDSANFTLSKLKGSKFNDCELSEANFSNTNLLGVEFEQSVLILANMTNADLTGSNLKNTDLSATNFKNSSLKGADLRDAKLKGTILTDCDLRVADLTGIDIHNTIFDGISLTGTKLNNSNLAGIDLTGLNFSGTQLQNANLSNASLDGMYLVGNDFNHSNLNGASFIGANLENANLSNSNLMGVDFTDALLNGANLKGANLEGAYCKGASFINSNFEDAILEDADMRVANLSNANFAGADTTNINISGALLDGTDINIVKNIETPIETLEVKPLAQIKEVRNILNDIVQDDAIKVEDIKTDVKEKKVEKNKIKEVESKKQVNKSFEITSISSIIDFVNSLSDFTTQEDIINITKNITYELKYKNSVLQSKFTEPFLQMAKLYQDSSYLSYLAFIGKQEQMIRLSKSERESFRLEFSVIDESIIINLSESISIFIEEMFDSFNSHKAAYTLMTIFIISGYMSIKELRDYVSNMENCVAKDILIDLISRYKLSISKEDKLKAILSPIATNHNIILYSVDKSFGVKEFINLKNHSSKKEEIKIEGEFLVDGASALLSTTPIFYLLSDSDEYVIKLSNSDSDKLKAKELIKRLQKPIFSTIHIEKVDGKIIKQSIGKIEIW